MAPNEFQLTTHWRMKGSVEDVYEILSNPSDFVRWWPSVYLGVREMESGDADGVGRTISLHTRGKLPYTLKWEARTTELDKPNRIALEAQGDLQGRGVWTFAQEGEIVDIRFNWNVSITKPWMRFLSPLLKPMFAANHRWAMRKGEESLKRELSRLGAGKGDEKDV